eukprot:GEMP01065517.1.p1 GENE.GEMP01065517.1~~GEMP01065517.1.p1  ORF type:complete len:165 (+),score=31.49 GEMP01065517.1:389-883(+)
MLVVLISSDGIDASGFTEPTYTCKGENAHAAEIRAHPGFVLGDVKDPIVIRVSDITSQNGPIHWEAGFKMDGGKRPGAVERQTRIDGGSTTRFHTFCATDDTPHKYGITVFKSHKDFLMALAKPLAKAILVTEAVPEAGGNSSAADAMNAATESTGSLAASETQ